MQSEISPLTKKLVFEKQQELVKLVVNWSFLTAGPPFESKKYDGSLIRYQGIKFEGSPRRVFWTGYIEPYLENYGLDVLKQVGGSALDCGVNIELAIDECVSSINGMIATVYNHMADVDSRLMGNGFEPAKKKDVSGYVLNMQKTIKGHAKMVKMKYEKMDSEQNKSTVTNNFHAKVENIQAGINNTQNSAQSASKKGVAQWILDHLGSVVVGVIVAAVVSLIGISG